MYSDEDDKRNNKENGRKKIKVFSLGYFSQLMNKKIYSDDFDMSSERRIRQKQKKQNYAGSLVEYPITEDLESEDHDYLSDYSSSSNFSFKKKKMSFDLSRLIDKLEPSAFDDSTSSLIGGGSKHYFSNMNDTILEEDDEDVLPSGSIASGHYSRLKAQHDRSASFKFLQLGSNCKPKKIRSICLESEPILEELDEYNGAHEFIDQRNHTFIIPSWVSSNQ